jgi:hypothetical protein
MAEYEATPEQWANIEEWVGDKLSCYLSIRELRARVEALEVNTKQWRTDHLRLANTCASLAPDRLKFFNALLPDDDNSQPAPNPSQIRSSLVERVADGISKPLQLTPEQAQQINDLLAPNSKSTPNPSQIRSSLVERVQQAINTEYEESLGTGSMEARAAIFEVAAWLSRESEGHLGNGAHWWVGRLQREAGR